MNDTNQWFTGILYITVQSSSEWMYDVKLAGGYYIPGGVESSTRRAAPLDQVRKLCLYVTLIRLTTGDKDTQ